MFKVKQKTAPKIFQDHFKLNRNKYQTRNSINNFLQPKTLSKYSSYSILNRGPRLWNIITDTDCKTLNSLLLFKKNIKRKLIEIEDEQKYF